MRKTTLCLLLALLSLALLSSLDAAIDKEEKPEDWQLKAARKIVEEIGLDCNIDQHDLIVFGSSFTISENETIRSDVLIVQGGLVIEGCVEGDAIVIQGSMYLSSTAVVKGKIMAIGGIIETVDGATVEKGFVEIPYFIPKTPLLEVPPPQAPPTPPEPAPELKEPPPRLDLQEPELDQLTRDLLERSKQKQLREGIIKLASDIYIAKNQVVEGDILALGGNIVIEGRVKGDVVSTVGDISIGPEGVVEGDVLAMLGKIDIKPGAKILGDVIEQSWDGSRCLKSQLAPDTSSTLRRLRAYGNLAGEVDYNRVDGLYLAVVLSQKQSRYPMPNYRFEGGYSFKRNRWLYDFEIEQPFLRSPRLLAGIHIYDKTESNDDDLISDAENIFAAAFLKRDYRDYFDLRGIAGFGALMPLDNHLIRLGYSKDEYRPLETKAHASIFRRKWDFAPNPVRSHQICESDTIGCKKVEINSFDLSYEFDSRPNDLLKTPDRGLWLRCKGEWARKDWGSTYSYNRYSAEIRKYLTISANQLVSLRLNLGLFDISPEKKTCGRASGEPQYFFPKEFYVGGIGTLPAYQYKQFRGTHMLLLNFEYAWQLRNQVWALFFWDAGDAKGSVPIDEWRRGDLWQALKLKSDAGVGLRYEDPGEYSVTVAMVKRLTKLDQTDQMPPVLILRATRMF